MKHHTSHPSFNANKGDCRSAKEIPTTHSKSHSSNEVNRNREYKIRRAALGDNPTQEEMAAVKAQGTISVSIDGTAYEGTASDVAQLINALRAA